MIGILKAGRLSPFDLVIELLDNDNAEYYGYRTKLYKPGNTKLSKILDSILGNHSGKQKLWSWMRPLALEIVSEAIDKEMDSVTKEEILPGISSITPGFIKSWTVADVGERTPFLTAVLLRAAQTSLAKENNKKKHPKAVCVEYSAIFLVLTFYTRCATSW
jgi:hypothetical protein